MPGFSEESNRLILAIREYLERFNANDSQTSEEEDLFLHIVQLRGTLWRITAKQLEPIVAAAAAKPDGLDPARLLAAKETLQLLLACLSRAPEVCRPPPPLSPCGPQCITHGMTRHGTARHQPTHRTHPTHSTHARTARPRTHRTHARHDTALHGTAPHGTAPHRTAPHRTAWPARRREGMRVHMHFCSYGRCS